ncbi:serine/threonine-protein phosphatase 6 regulatory subunit 3-like isoform X3 [Eriocheir sinensis]|uniref:serine/threonine-protein phosphatase 6 regulatory subunit 3-like isoform X3 n=1 Tax=Eriocheir sinensis TaxID=95602 RepID=UPI0021C56A0F|nr:serine/threonine-protein phosphatase 6 regulatory subunit 3-like isoform X3 [Eriocheir sinensis]
MFWKYNFGSSAQIETLLQKEDVTLSELMDEDELLQECKAQNKKLIDFLTRAEVLDELVFLVVNEPSTDGELQMRFKYANLAAELLTADVPAIIDKLVASTGLLDVLYKFLKKEKPLNPLLASFFSKVLGMLVQRRSEQVLDFLKSKGDFVELAVQHVGTSAIMDLLLRLICNVEEDEIRQSVHQWLNDCQLIERLVERLSPEADPDEHSSADSILCEISASCRDAASEAQQVTNPLLQTLESEETINKMLDLLLHEERNESSLAHVINILLTLLSARSSMPSHPSQQQVQQQQQQQLEQEQGLQQSSSIDSSDSESSEGKRNIVARTVAKRLPNLHNILLHPPKKGLIPTAYGQELEPLGSTRLQVVTLVAALVVANDPIVHNALYELNTVEHLLDLFFKFMLNNFLHTQVEQCLTAILTKAPSTTSPEGAGDHLLLTQLFTQCRIIERLVAAYEDNSESQDGKQIHNMRGYMGHLRQLANTIVQQAEIGPNEHRIKQLIQDLPGDKATQWDDFVSNALAEVNRKNEITPLPVQGIHHHLESDDDSDDHSDFFPEIFDGPIIKEWISMLSISSSGSKHEWGLTEGEADQPDEGPSFLQVGHEEEEDGGEDKDRVLYQHMEASQVWGGEQGFKEMDMDVIGDFRYADDEFKDQDDNLSGPLQRLTTQALALSGVTGVGGGTPSGNQGVEGGGEAGIGDRDLFEELCSNRSSSMGVFDDMWTDKEKEITFSQESQPEESEKDKEQASSSEDEDEEDISGLRAGETKMEVDQDGFCIFKTEWAEVFDKRPAGEGDDKNEPVNPWNSAPMSDTADNTGWADFSPFTSSASVDPFGKKLDPERSAFAPDFSGVFSNPTVSQQDSSTTVFGENASTQEAFRADFSNINFDSAFETNCDDHKNTVTSTGEPQNSEFERADREETMRREEKEEVEEEEVEKELMDNFNFLSSRGLMKKELEDCNEAGTASTTLSQGEAKPGDSQPQQEEVAPSPSDPPVES